MATEGVIQPELVDYAPYELGTTGDVMSGYVVPIAHMQDPSAR